MTIPAGAWLEYSDLNTPGFRYAGLYGEFHRHLIISADTVSYDLYFTMFDADGNRIPKIEGITESDFEVVATGDATARVASVTPIKIAGVWHHHVTIDQIGGNGTIQLGLVEPGHGEADYQIPPLIIDTAPPELLSTSILTPAGDYTNGGQINFEVDFSERIAVHGGVPSLLLSNGAEAVYAGGSGTGRMLFTYAVAPIRPPPTTSRSSASMRMAQPRATSPAMTSTGPS